VDSVDFYINGRKLVQILLLGDLAAQEAVVGLLDLAGELTRVDGFQLLEVF
jgi:hypothetical protein